MLCDVWRAVWLAEVYAGFFASFVAHVMNSWAVSGTHDHHPTHQTDRVLSRVLSRGVLRRSQVHHCTPTIPALYGCLQPVVGVALSIVLLGETFDLRDVCSVGLIIGGLVVVTMKGLKLHGTPSAVGLDTLVSHHHHPDSPLQFELQLKGEEEEDSTTGTILYSNWRASVEQMGAEEALICVESKTQERLVSLCPCWKPASSMRGSST